MLKIRATIEINIITDLGSIEAELYPKLAPVTVSNFLANIACGLYEGGQFHRATSKKNASDNEIAIEVIEATKAEWKADRDPIVHENVLHDRMVNDVGTLSMSRMQPGSATTGFFINLCRNPVLDAAKTTSNSETNQGYIPFGIITHGMDIARRIHQRPRGQRMLSESELDAISTLGLTKAESDILIEQLLNHSVRIHRIEVK